MPKRPAIEDIDPSWAGETVRVDGEINSKSFSGGNLFLEIGQRNLTVVRFDTTDRFEEGDRVTVEGTIQIYRGELEIIADSIE